MFMFPTIFRRWFCCRAHKMVSFFPLPSTCRSRSVCWCFFAGLLKVVEVSMCVPVHAIAYTMGYFTNFQVAGKNSSRLDVEQWVLEAPIRIIRIRVCDFVCFDIIVTKWCFVLLLICYFHLITFADGVLFALYFLCLLSYSISLLPLIFLYIYNIHPYIFTHTLMLCYVSFSKLNSVSNFETKQKRSKKGSSFGWGLCGVCVCIALSNKVWFLYLV